MVRDKKQGQLIEPLRLFIGKSWFDAFERKQLGIRVKKTGWNVVSEQTVKK